MPVYLISYETSNQNKNLELDEQINQVVEKTITEINSKSNCCSLTSFAWYLDSPKPPNEIARLIKIAVRERNKKIKLDSEKSTSDISIAVHELSHLYVLEEITPNTISWITNKLPPFKLTRFRPVEIEGAKI